MPHRANTGRCVWATQGGFCLWPTAYQNYSVENSGLWERGEKVDIVQEFVQSCQKYNIKPCFYLGPNANGYQTQVAKASSEEFVKAQYGMITEALTHYGFIDRLWWDHYEDGCGGLSECPKCDTPGSPYCFPAAWANFTSLVHEVSPGTLMGTGPDIAHSAGGESGGGQYPAWNTCNTTDGSPLTRCKTYGTDPYGQIFRPFEADVRASTRPGCTTTLLHSSCLCRVRLRHQLYEVSCHV